MDSRNQFLINIVCQQQIWINWLYDYLLKVEVLLGQLLPTGYLKYQVRHNKHSDSLITKYIFRVWRPPPSEILWQFGITKIKLRFCNVICVLISNVTKPQNKLLITFKGIIHKQKKRPVMVWNGRILNSGLCQVDECYVAKSMDVWWTVSNISIWECWLECFISRHNSAQAGEFSSLRQVPMNLRLRTFPSWQTPCRAGSLIGSIRSV